MVDSVSYSLNYSEDLCLLDIKVPELDLEHEDSIVLEVQQREIVFTLPPYHVRIPVEKDLQQIEVFPKNIDYEKSTLQYEIPLRKAVSSDQESTQVQHSYGFGNLYNGTLNFQNSQDFKSCSNPEMYSNEERKQKRLVDEQEDFNAEHYGMDHVQYLIDEFGLASVDIPEDVKLSDDQKHRVRMIVDEKKKELDKYRPIRENVPILNGLVDILLATLYDKLINFNELNEAISHVNIHRISASLSYFETFESLEDVLIAFYRRSAVYPLYRNKNLARRCVDLLVSALKQDNVTEWLLEKLLHCYEAFKTNDCVLLNHYFIKDYIRLVQICSPIESLSDVGSELEKLLPSLHNKPLGFGEETIVRRFVRDIIGKDDDSTDSDDTSGESDSESETESSETSSDEEPKPEEVDKPEESVLEKLMNLKIQI